MRVAPGGRSRRAHRGRGAVGDGRLGLRDRRARPALGRRRRGNGSTLPVPKGAERPSSSVRRPSRPATSGPSATPSSRAQVAAHAIVDHWNGHSWRLVPGPPTGGYSRLFGMTASPRRTSGQSATSASPPAERIDVPSRSRVHWNGTAWKRLPSPSPATSSRCAGSIGDSSPRSPASLARRLGGRSSTTSSRRTATTRCTRLGARSWDGTRWKAARAPTAAGPTHRELPLRRGGTLCDRRLGGRQRRAPRGAARARRALGRPRWRIVPATGAPRSPALSAVTADDAWAVGGVQRRGTSRTGTAVAWTVQTSSSDDAGLDAVAEVSPTDVWAVGVLFDY